MGIREMFSGETQKANAVCHVVNSMGLHARPACILVQEAVKFEAEIRIAGGACEEGVDAKSLMSILTLAAGKGTRLEISAEGKDAQSAVDTLVQLFENGFDED
ncbi:MAG: HPr family phosphocarrier protein [Lentisphaeria bacterium]|nr:HPr family phosphocarrier protein [Lentisphaeria bacterium]